MVKGLVINKFRGDIEILRPGLEQIAQITGVPVVGTVPCLDVDIDDEDSLSDRFYKRGTPGLLDIAVVRLPRISNFTDFNPLSAADGISLRYVHSTAELAAAVRVGSSNPKICCCGWCSTGNLWGVSDAWKTASRPV